MKRRNFLLSLFAPLAAPLVVKKAVAEERLTATEAIHGCKPSPWQKELMDAMTSNQRIYVLKSRRAGYGAKQAEALRELEKHFGKGCSRRMSANLEKTGS